MRVDDPNNFEASLEEGARQLIGKLPIVPGGGGSGAINDEEAGPTCRGRSGSRL